MSPFCPNEPQWAVSFFLISLTSLLFQVCIKTSCSFLLIAHKLFYLWHNWSFRHSLKITCSLTYFYTHIFRQIMKVLQTNLSHLIRSWELCNIVSYYALNSKKNLFGGNLTHKMHAVLSVFATCSAVSCYVNMAFHHFLSPHPLDCASFTPSSTHFHWVITTPQRVSLTLGSSICNRTSWL